MANLIYTKEVKSTLRLFCNRTYFQLYSDYLQTDLSNYVIKPKKKIFDFHNKKAKEKASIWPIISNLILTKSALDIANIYLAYLALKTKKKIRYVSSKYSIPLKEVIKDYLFLCNERIKIKQRNKAFETYTLGLTSNNDYKNMLLSSLFPNISRNKKVTMRFTSGGNGEDDVRSYFQTSLYFYDEFKEEEKRVSIKTPLIRIMEIDNKMKKIMKNLLIERNNQIGKITNFTGNTNPVVVKNIGRNSEVTLPSHIKYISSTNNCNSEKRSRNKTEKKVIRVSSYFLPQKEEVLNFKLLKIESKTTRKYNTPSKIRTRSVKMVIDPTLLIHHRDLYYLK